MSLATVIVNRCYILLWGDGEIGSQACAPQMSMSEARRAVLRLLPGATVKRRLLWRYTVDWTKPRPVATPGHATVSEDEVGPSTHPRPTVAVSAQNGGARFRSGHHRAPLDSHFEAIQQERCGKLDMPVYNSLSVDTHRPLALPQPVTAEPQAQHFAEMRNSAFY